MFNPNFDRLFKSERWWLLKVAGAGVLGLLMAIRVVWELRNELAPFEMMAYLVVISALVMLMAGAFVRADTIRCRISAGEPVGLVSRVLYGAGIWSLLFWVVGLLIVGFVLAIWLGRMTWDQPAGKRIRLGRQILPTNAYAELQARASLFLDPAPLSPSG